MKVKCVKLVTGKYGKEKNAIEWDDEKYPIKHQTYTVTDTQTDCEGDKGYQLEGLTGWWSATLFETICKHCGCTCNKL